MKELDLLWVDIETTGLEPRTDAILEIAVARSKGLGPLGGITTYVLSYPSAESAWKRIDPAVVEMHTKNRLREECDGSSLSALSVYAALRDFVGSDQPVLAGSSVHFDRSFLAADFPSVVRGLHYRNLDVSAIRSFCYACGMPELPKVDSPHRATHDLIASHALLLTCAEWAQRPGNTELMSHNLRYVGGLGFDEGYSVGYQDASRDYAAPPASRSLVSRVLDRVLCRKVLP